MFLLDNDLSFLPLSSPWFLIYPYTYRHTQSLFAFCNRVAFCNWGPLFTIGGGWHPKAPRHGHLFLLPPWLSSSDKDAFRDCLLRKVIFTYCCLSKEALGRDYVWESLYVPNDSLPPAVNASPQKWWKGSDHVFGWGLAELTEKNPLPYSVSQSGHTPCTFLWVFKYFPSVQKIYPAKVAIKESACQSMWQREKSLNASETKHLFPECDFPKSLLSPLALGTRDVFSHTRDSDAQRCGNMEDVMEIPRGGGGREWSAPQPSCIRDQQPNASGNVLRSFWLEDRTTQSSVAEWVNPDLGSRRSQECGEITILYLPHLL